LQRRYDGWFNRTKQALVFAINSLNTKLGFCILETLQVVFVSSPFQFCASENLLDMTHLMTINTVNDAANRIPESVNA
jgi:hypothetical protein